MIVEMRTYTVLPDKLSRWLAIWEQNAKPVQSEILGQFLGMYLTDIGPVNEVVHLWRFDSLAERERRREIMEKDPRWSFYRREVEALAPVTLMQSRILRPTRFSPFIQAATI